MDRIIQSAEGYPLSREWLTFFENQSLEPINALVTAIGNNAIVSGMINTDGNVSAGTFIYNDELLPFTAGPFGETVIIVETEVSEGYDTAEDDSFDEILPVWAVRVARFGNPAETGVVASFPFSLLKRLDNVEELNDNRLKLLKEGTVSLEYDSDLFPSHVVVTGDFTSGTQAGNAMSLKYFATIFFDPLPNTNYFLIFEPDIVTQAFYPFNHYFSRTKNIDSVGIQVDYPEERSRTSFKLKLYGI